MDWSGATVGWVEQPPSIPLDLSSPDSVPVEVHPDQQRFFSAHMRNDCTSHMCWTSTLTHADLLSTSLPNVAHGFHHPRCRPDRRFLLLENQDRGWADVKNKLFYIDARWWAWGKRKVTQITDLSRWTLCTPVSLSLAQYRDTVVL